MGVSLIKPNHNPGLFQQVFCKCETLDSSTVKLTIHVSSCRAAPIALFWIFTTTSSQSAVFQSERVNISIPTHSLWKTCSEWLGVVMNVHVELPENGAIVNGQLKVGKQR